MGRDADLTTQLGADRDAIVRRARRAERVLLCLDFDGTLAPITASPDEARILPAARDALERLDRCDRVAVAVVSGRALTDVRDRVAVPGLVYAGNHGLERRFDGERIVHPAAEDARRALAELCGTLEQALADVDGCVVEDKGLTATVHHRRVADDRVDDVVERVERAVSDRDDLRLTTGNAVVEVRPAVDWGKGAAVSSLVERVDGDPFVLYVGDDTTDESAFRAVRPDGVGIYVGAPTETAATCRLPDPASVADFLDWLADTLTAPPND